MMNLRILKALLKKEVRLMMRNPFIPRIIVMLPLMAMLVLPLVANLDVKNVGVAVVDNDRSELSRRIAADMDASEFLSVKSNTFLYSEALQLVERGQADAILVIPADYAENLVKGRQPVLSLDANGVNATKGMLGARYASQSAIATIAQWQSEQGHAFPAPEDRKSTRLNSSHQD